MGPESHSFLQYNLATMGPASTAATGWQTNLDGAIARHEAQLSSIAVNLQQLSQQITQLSQSDPD